MGMKRNFLFFVPAVALLVFLYINSAFADCDSGYSTITLRVKAAFYEQSVTSAYSSEKSIESSSAYKKAYDSLSVDVSASAGFKLFSGSASSSVSRVTDSVSRTTKYSETIKTKETQFDPKFLQIIEVITTELSIDGATAKIVEQNYVDSVPTDESLSPAELTKRARTYINNTYGQGDEGSDWKRNDWKIVGSTYSQSVCQRKQKWTGLSNGNKKWKKWGRKATHLCNHGKYVNIMAWKEQSNYGLVDWWFKCTDGYKYRMTENPDGDWNSNLACSKGYDQIKGREQSGYGIVNVGVSCVGSPSTFVDSNTNKSGRNNGVLSCPSGLHIIGIETREQDGYGIVDFRVKCG